MEGEKSDLLFLGAGPLAAILLGMALVPLRGVTPASNLSFAFMALTIVTAEFGGRAAAVGTALMSALSLDFFLTEPYLKLSIEDHHDVVAFVGLAVCGLIAAGLGSYRGERIAALTTVRTHRDLLHRILLTGDEGGPIAPQLAEALNACRHALPLAGAALRDETNRLVACAEAADERRPVPADALDPVTLLPGGGPGRGQSGWNPPLPAHGGRIGLTTGRVSLGWLDVWGNGRPADAESRRALSDVARLMALLLARCSPGPIAPDGTASRGA